MAKRNFPHWLKAYMEFTRASEAPNQFHFWTGISTIAGALRRRVWIDMLHFQWTPNFYIVLVGPPGVATKSTTTRAGMSLLETVPGVQFGPQSGTWHAVAQTMEAAFEYVSFQLPDGTDDKVAMSAVTINVPELGTFFKMEDRSLIDVLISMWDGQKEKWGHKTKVSGNIEVINPWLNLIACTTPSWLEGNFPEHMIGGGLTSRVLFVYGDQKRHYVAYPDEVVQTKEYAETKKKLSDDLQQIALLSGPFEITDSARIWGREWYEHLWKNRPSSMGDDRYSGYISRKQTHMHKLAMVLAAAQRQTLMITREDLIEADALLTSVEPHMIKVFESVGVVDESKHVASILAYVRAYKWISANELFNLMRNNITERDFKNAIRISLDGGLLKIESRIVNGQTRPGLTVLNAAAGRAAP
jgi:hypothetical protein